MAFKDLFLADEMDVVGIVQVSPPPQQNHRRVAVLDEIRHPVLDLQHRERRVRQLALPAHGQGRGDGADALVERDAPRQHGPQNRRGERGQDVRLHAAAESVRQHEHFFAVVFKAPEKIAAQLFIMLVEAGPAAFKELDFRFKHGVSPRRPS